MAWETRGGKRYYYRKVRCGRKVISRYAGAGPIGLDAEAEDHRLRKRRDEAKHLEGHQAEIFKNLSEVDQQVRDTERFAQSIFESALLCAGYYQHRREWRKKRCQTP